MISGQWSVMSGQWPVTSGRRNGTCVQRMLYAGLQITDSVLDIVIIFISNC